jgi:hypothetical protein
MVTEQGLSFQLLAITFHLTRALEHTMADIHLSQVIHQLITSPKLEMQTGFPKNGKMLKNLFILVYKNTQ